MDLEKLKFFKIYVNVIKTICSWLESVRRVMDERRRLLPLLLLVFVYLNAVNKSSVKQ